MEYNGGTVLGMIGDRCVGLACDLRFGINQLQTVGMGFDKVFQTSPLSLVGLTGLATDIQSVKAQLEYSTKLYRINEGRHMPVDTLSHYIATMLYNKRFAPWFCEPICAGLTENGTPFLSGYDTIGTESFSPDFVASGTAAEQTMGVAETYWRPNLPKDELFEVLSQAFIAAIDRDCYSGYGGNVYILDSEGNLSVKSLKTRMD